MKKTKKRYEVTLYYHTSCTVEVEAKSEEDALAKARNMDTNDELLESLQEDDDPDICELDEDDGKMPWERY